MKKTSIFAILFFVLSTSAFAIESEGILSEAIPEGLTPADEITSGTGAIPSPDVGSNHRDWEFQCFANNPRGVVFWAIHPRARVAQDRAMRLCFQYPPFLCRPLGCREVEVR